MPRKPLKQATLVEFLSSSPRVAESPPKITRPKTRSKKSKAPMKKRKRSPSVSSPDSDAMSPSDSSNLDAVKFEPEVREITSDSNLSISSPLPTSRRRLTKRRKRGVSSDSNNSEMEVAPMGRSVKSKGKQRQTRASVRVKDSDVESNVPRTRLRKGARSPVHSEEENLSDEVDEKDIIEARFRTRDKKNAFQRNLERLKRKKQGKVMSSSEDEGEGEEDQDEELYVSPFKGARPGTIADEDLSDVSDHSAGKDDEEGSDFIVEDNGAGLEQLPIHFSMDSHQDLAHQFKKVFQFFCHIAVQPASARHGYMARQMKHEEYFYVPLEVFRRKLSGLRDSLVASSVWRADFKRKLDTYPEFETVALDFSMPGCHACHLGGRMSTILGRLGGKPYDRLGFQSLKNNDNDVNDDGDSDDDNNENNSDDSSEKETEFNLGRFCAQRTRVYHQFTHWEYALFQSISGDIDEARGGSFVRVAFLGGREPPRDPNDADGFCDWFDEGKVIAMEWRRLREMMDSAQRLEMAAKRGDED